MLNEKLIEEIKEKIIKSISPKKIILFGSYAKDTATEDSDIDLMVIWNSELNPHKRNLYLRRLFPKRNFSLDIFAFTENEFESLKDVVGTMLYEAAHFGKVLYG